MKPHLATKIGIYILRTTLVFWGYIGIMEKNMDTTICPKL